jgi:elongation factor P
MQYLYPDGEDYVFMDLESYEQIHLGPHVLVNREGFLLPNEEVQVNFYNEQPIGVELPTTVTLEVTETEAAVKGQTAAGSGKPAVLETGLRVVVPTFVSIGDRIRINTETGEYIERSDR